MTTTASNDPAAAVTPTEVLTGPLANPEVDRVDRMILASWNVGEPDADGWQRLARLVVHWVKGYGYDAHLTGPRIQNKDGIVTEHFAYGDPRVQIRRESGYGRFNKGTFGHEYEHALEELRKRFTAGDAEVTAFFTVAPDRTED